MKYPSCDFESLLTQEDELWTSELEEWESCSKRCHAAIEYMWALPEQKIALVFHGGLLHSMLNQCKDIVADDELKARFTNAEIRVMTVERDSQGTFRFIAPKHVKE